ncbi:hypothetical protein QJS10_CPA08g00583 [Acorus calamus]|uniref:Reverse transcriptase zinc-binding domain-containing protein n=1 Tax=Acorus calamus TaxID=4465 RepID=A0AAV9EDR9_ACOCL|nr:hypothetical protein QJS10_CPA08g00583 [Acorus calamus]
MEMFFDWIAEEGLMDLPISNKNFTWSNLWEDLSLAKLDRVLIDPEWEETFPMCSLRGLPWAHVRRNLKDEEVDSYLSLLELLQEVAVDHGRLDEIVWSPKPYEGFSIRSCYAWLRRDIPATSIIARKYKELWGCHIPLKVKAFMWTLYLDKVLMKLHIVTWNPGINTTCALCSVKEESAEHLFVRCVVARRVWGWLEEAYGMNASFSTAEELWATGNAL